MTFPLKNQIPIKTPFFNLEIEKSLHPVITTEKEHHGKKEKLEIITITYGKMSSAGMAGSVYLLAAKKEVERRGKGKL